VGRIEDGLGQGRGGSEHSGAPDSSCEPLTDRGPSTIEELQLRERQQAMVADLGRFALELADEQELLEIAVKLLADGLEVPLTAAMQLGEDPEWLEIRAGTGWDAFLLGTNRVSGQPSTLAGYTLLKDGPVVCDDLAAETRFEGGPGLHVHNVASAMSTIIRMPGRPYGVLGAYSVRPRSFSEDDIVFARSIANLLGASFARREVEEELRSLVAVGHRLRGELVARAGGGVWPGARVVPGNVRCIRRARPPGRP
jgi:GAF domain-containing protein